MFRKIKKWYFKIYHLFKLLSVFILIFGLCNRVYAEEYNNCFDNIKVGNATYAIVSTTERRIRPAIKVNQNKKYYIRYFPENNFICPDNTKCFGNEFMYWKTDNGALGRVTTKSEWDNNKQILTFEVPTWTSYTGQVQVNPIILSNYTGYSNMEGNPFIISDNINEVLYCNGIPPEEPSNENEVYTSFLTLYTDKISYLANGFTSNPYLLAMIGIIFSFIVLELFLKILHLKGGKHR